MRYSLIVVAACLVSCRGCNASDTWPPLPQSNEEATQTFAGATKRPATKDESPFQREATFAFVMSNLPSSKGAKDSVAGWQAIDERLASWVNEAPERSAVVAFGTSYDSPGQLDAFRRLIGPHSAIHWTHVLLEQLHADGHWKGVDAEVQAGDDTVLERFEKSGARATLSPIAARVERDRYVPWKFGSSEVFVDVIADARVAGRSVTGCDMSSALRTRIESLDEEATGRTRDLHCALALRDRTKKDGGIARVAALWERTHASYDRFPRLAPADWTAKRILMMDAPNEDRIVLVDPILTLGGVLVLSSPSAETRFERRLSKGAGPAPKSSFRSTTTKTLREPIAWLDGERFDGSKPVEAGRHFLNVDKSGTTIAAVVDVPAEGGFEVVVADDAPDVTVTILTR